MKPTITYLLAVILVACGSPRPIVHDYSFGPDVTDSQKLVVYEIVQEINTRFGCEALRLEGGSPNKIIFKNFKGSGLWGDWLWNPPALELPDDINNDLGLRELIAHEFGHSLGANHVETKDIMYRAAIAMPLTDLLWSRFTAQVGHDTACN